MPEPTRQYIFSAQMIRAAFVASGVGMVAVIAGLLILATSRPQGRLQPADTSQFEATLAEASEDLEGFERIGADRARIDVDTAMELVVERGVALTLVAIGADAAEVADQAEGQPDGAALFGNCSGCHQATGEGIPGAFPPLARHLPAIYNTDGGRSYLINVLLYGLQGEIVVEETSYSGLMPSWQQLSDAEIAAVLNHELAAWGNDALVVDFVPYAAEEVAPLRGQGLSMSDVNALRSGLDIP